MKKLKNIVKLFLFVFMLFLFIYLGTKDYQTTVSDNVRFSGEYKDISKNNVFKYVGEHEVLEVLNGKSGILFFGFPSNIWSHYYADYLNEMALVNGISEIYYYDFKKDRNLNNVTYNNIVLKLKEYLATTDLGNQDLTAPTIVFVKSGNVLYFDDEIAHLKGNVTPEEYFTDYQKSALKTKFDVMIKNYLRMDKNE